MKNLLKFLSVSVMLAASASVASATTISFTITDNGTQIGTGTNNLGIISLTGSDANFSISGNAVGTPAQPAPDLSTNNFDLATDGAAGTIVISITETGLTSPITPVKETFTTNSTDSDGFLSDTIFNYFDNTDAPDGTQNTFGSASYNGNDSFSSGMTGLVSPTGTYSETTVYTLIFGSTTQTEGSVSASDQIVATGATPEPNSLVLLGTGLMSAAGVVFRRRRSVA